MKILAIRGCNLASLATEFAIELCEEPLLSSGLFGITGPTGAGKSTILDALCLALFDRIPRLDEASQATGGTDQIKTADPRNILSKGKSHAWAEVDFQGADKKSYRARWELRRARGQAAGRLQPQQLTLRDLQTGKQLGRTKSEVLKHTERALGLNYAQFRRSVLLAQGDFAAFLKASENERAELLERMTGTEIYSQISRLAYQRAQKEQQQLATLEGILAELKPLSAQARQALVEERDHQQRFIKSLQTSISSKEKDLEWFLRNDELAAWRNEVQQSLEKREGERKQFKLLRQEITEREQVEVLQLPLEQATRWQKQLSGSEKKLAQLRKEKDAVDSALESKKAQLIEQWSKKAFQASQSLQEAEQWLSSRHYLAPLAADWQQWKALFERYHRNSSLLGKQQQKLEKLRKELAAQTAACKALQEQRGKLVEDLEACKMQLSLQELRQELSSDCPCPLCGSREHPWTETEQPQSSHNEGLSLDLQVKQEELSQLEEKLLETDQYCQQVANSTELADRELCKTQSSLEEMQLQLEARLGALPNWKALSTTELENLLQAWQREVKKRDTARDQYQEAESTLSLLQQNDWKLRLSTLTSLSDLKQLVSKETELSKNLEHEQLQLKHCQQEEERSRNALQEVLSVKEISLERAQELLKKSASWIAESKERLCRWEQEVEQLKGRLIQCTTLIEDHKKKRPEDCERSALEENLRSLKQKKAQAEQAQQGLELQLAKDLSQRAKAKELELRIHKQRSQTELWESLRMLIGSADGQKFRKYAQVLTLDMLVQHANQQLEEIMPRYRLERVEDAGLHLQVLDRDMADEVRSVNSLSGGESFLVSLALALGLASLSVEKSSIKSLFIDEGFGALDPHSVDLAIDVLDNLQASGRQIGIISHLPALTERLGTAVRVQPRGGGVSTVGTVSSTETASWRGDNHDTESQARSIART